LHKPAMSNPPPEGHMRPSWRFCAAQLCFRCSKSSLPADNLFLFW